MTGVSPESTTSEIEDWRGEYAEMQWKCQKDSQWSCLGTDAKALNGTFLEECVRVGLPGWALSLPGATTGIRIYLEPHNWRADQSKPIPDPEPNGITPRDLWKLPFLYLESEFLTSSLDVEVWLWTRDGPVRSSSRKSTNRAIQSNYNLFGLQ